MENILPKNLKLLALFSSSLLFLILPERPDSKENIILEMMPSKGYPRQIFMGVL